MARYPTFEEYEKSGKYNDGLKRTNDLLKKNQKDVQLLVLRLRFLSALRQDTTPSITELLAVQPPVQDLDDLVEIENAVVESQRDDFPQPTTSEPAVAKFWDAATKASASQNVKLDLLSLRFARAIAHRRLLDAQQALIQLKALLPSNRTVYTAHAAITYLLSTEKGDMHARLALMLARKAVRDGFDKEDPNLDCRVPGQIFAASGESADLKAAEGTRYGSSKQAIEALRRIRRKEGQNVEGEGEVQVIKDGASDADSLETQLAQKKAAFARLATANTERSDLASFTISAIQFFDEMTKTIPRGDRKRIKADACFLSISSLIRLFADQKDSANGSMYLLFAAYLAETLLRQDENIHEARMILVYLYMRLNLGSLALQMFHSLRVKEIQNDTVGHALFTQISRVLPFTAGETKQRQSKTEAVDPKKLANNALAVYERCERKLRETEAAVLSHGSTGMIFDLEELSASLRTSITRRIIHLEQRSLARLVDSGTGEDASLLGPRVTANWITTTDNRDFKATFKFGYEVERVLYGNGGETVPGKEWIVRALMADAAWCLALGKEAPVNDVDVLVQEFEQLQVDLGSLKINGDKDGNESSASLVDAEVLAGDLSYHALRLLKRLHASNDIHATTTISDDVHAMRSAIDRIPALILSDDDSISSTSMSQTANLRDHYAYLDVLRIIEKAASPIISAKEPAAHGDALAELKKLAQIKRSQLQTRARVHRDGVNPSKIKAFMMQDSALSKAVSPLNGVKDLDVFCEAISTSAKEGWDGVGKVK